MRVVLCCALAASAACGARTVETRYPSGALESRTHVRSGTPHGEAVGYHEGGGVAWRGAYENGDRHGVFVYYDPNGNVVRREIYRRGEELWESTDPSELPPTRGLEIGLAERFARAEEPTFATTEWISATSHAHARFGFGVARPGVISRAADAHYTAMRADVFGQLMRGHWGFYVHVPIALLAESSSPTSFGKLLIDAGGAFAHETAAGRILVRAGLVAPIANDNLDGYAATAAVADARVGDLITTVPRSMAARAALSWASERGRFYYRIDGGADAAFDINGDRELSMTESALLLGRVNAAAGFGTEAGALSLESANAVWITDPGAGDRGDYSVALTFAVRVDGIDPSFSAVINSATFAGDFESFFLTVGYSPLGPTGAGL